MPKHSGKMMKKAPKKGAKKTMPKKKPAMGKYSRGY